MKRLAHVAMLLVAATFVGADNGGKKADNGDKKKGDVEKIQGKWIVVESFHKGKKVDLAVGNVFAFTGTKITIVPKGSDPKFEAAFELRPDKNPRGIDVAASVLAEIRLKMIYELSATL